MNSREAIRINSSPSNEITPTTSKNTPAPKKTPKMSMGAIPFTGNLNHWATIKKASSEKSKAQQDKSDPFGIQDGDGAGIVNRIPSGILDEHSHHLRHNVPKRLQFETLKERQTRQIMKMEQKKEYVNLNDHVRRDDDDLTHYVRDMCTMVRDSKYFKIFELVVIFMAFAELGMEDIVVGDQQKPQYFVYIGEVVNAFFTVELAVRWYSGFKLFWKDFWCVLDFVAILPSILALYSPLMAKLRFLIVLRFLRILRFIRKWTLLSESKTNKQSTKFGVLQEKLIGNVSLVINTIVNSLSSMVNIIVLMLVFFIFFGIVSVDMIGKYSTDYGSIGNVIWTCFVILTQDGWVDVYYRAHQEILPNNDIYVKDVGERETARTYLTSITIGAILLGGFMFANLIVAVVASNLDNSIRKRQEEREGSKNIFDMDHEMNKMEVEEDETSNKLKNEKSKLDDSEELKNTTSGENGLKTTESGGTVGESGDGNKLDDIFVKVLPFMQIKGNNPVHAQLNINNEPFSNIKVEKIEDFYAMLYALEENLVEYIRLRSDIDEILQEVWKLNTPTEDDAVDLYGNKGRETRREIQGYFMTGDTGATNTALPSFE